jgi:uncharacterized coiled-coil DUF342 family protein
MSVLESLWAKSPLGRRAARDDAEAVRKLLNTPGARKLLSEAERVAAVETLEARRALVAKISEIEADRDKRLAELRKHEEAAKEEYAERQHALNAAAARWRLCRGRCEGLSASAQVQVDYLRAQLRRSAPPEIDDALDQVDELSEKTREMRAEAREEYKENAWGQPEVTKCFSSRPSITARLDALRAARQAIDELRYQATPDVGQAIHDILAAVPDGRALVEV